MSHSWRFTGETLRYCYECGIAMRQVGPEKWSYVWPTFGPSFKMPFCDDEVEPTRPEGVDAI